MDHAINSLTVEVCATLNQNKFIQSQPWNLDKNDDGNSNKAPLSNVCKHLKRLDKDIILMTNGRHI